MSKKHTQPLAEADITLSEGHFLRKVPIISGVIGLIAIVATLVLSQRWESKPIFYGSYLVAFLFFLTIAFGGLFFVLIHHITRAGWSVVIRRLVEHILGTFPLLVLFAIPMYFGLEYVFDWMKHPIESKAIFLNKPFFLIRAGFYFMVWLVISRFFISRSHKQDETGELELTERLQHWSPVSLALTALTLTFASFDWIMSVDAHWFSTIFGVYIFAGSIVAIYSFLSIYSLVLRGTGMLGNIITAEHYQDMGKMMFGFVVFWTYIAFSQFMLIWYANIPEETMWYAYRLKDFGTLTYVLVACHFVIPFFFLMSRHVKRNPIALFIASVWLLVIHVVDLYWLVMPGIYHHLGHAAHAAPSAAHGTSGAAHGAAHAVAHVAKHAHFHTGDLIPLVLALVGMGGLFVAVVTKAAQKGALIPKKDPRLNESLAFENT